MSYADLSVDLYESLMRGHEGSKDVMVSPEMARHILDSQPDKTVNYRSPRRAKVSLLTDYIKTDQWYGDLAQVHLDPQGNVLNGLHTLTAIAEAGETVPVTVHFSVPDEAHDYFDPTSQGRTPAQHMNKLGYSMSGAAQVLSIVHTFQLVMADPSLQVRMDGRKDRQDNKWLTETAEDTPAFQKWANTAAAIVKKHPIQLPGNGRYNGAALKAVAILLLSAGHSEATLHDFFAGLARTKLDGVTDPRLKCVETLAEIPNVASSASSVDQSVRVLLHGFKKWYIGEPTSKKFPSVASLVIPTPK